MSRATIRSRGPTAPRMSCASSAATPAALEFFGLGAGGDADRRRAWSATSSRAARARGAPSGGRRREPRRVAALPLPFVVRRWTAASRAAPAGRGSARSSLPGVRAAFPLLTCAVARAAGAFGATMGADGPDVFSPGRPTSVARLASRSMISASLSLRGVHRRQPAIFAQRRAVLAVELLGLVLIAPTRLEMIGDAEGRAVVVAPQFRGDRHRPPNRRRRRQLRSASSRGS